jgi:hypothetical protein
MENSGDQILGIVSILLVSVTVGSHDRKLTVIIQF